MDHIILQLTTPVHPTPTQNTLLERLINEVEAVQNALCKWYMTLVFGAESVVSTQQALVPSIPADLLAMQVNQLVNVFGATLPTATVAALTHRFGKMIRGQVGQRVYRSQLPQPCPAQRVPLDAGVIAVNAYQVHIAGWPDLLVSDLWRLPLGLTSGLLDSGAVALTAFHEEVTHLYARDQAGDPAALPALQAQMCLYAPLLGRPGGQSVVPRNQPHRSGYATLHRHLTVNGTIGWAITWSIRVPPGFLPAVIHRDVVGVDPGVRAPLTWCSGSTSGQMARGPLGGATASAASVQRPTFLLEEAVRRCAWFRRTSQGLDDVLRVLLTYETIAVEDTNWARLSDDGYTWPRDVMDLTGVVEVLGWLQVLSMQRSRVVRVPAWNASHKCGVCGHRGTRTISTNRFLCSSCNYESCGDLNAALYVRWWTIHRYI